MGNIVSRTTRLIFYSAQDKRELGLQTKQKAETKLRMVHGRGMNGMSDVGVPSGNVSLSLYAYHYEALCAGL
jgi:hypothetical protein